jgi:hypothetical protein
MVSPANNSGVPVPLPNEQELGFRIKEFRGQCGSAMPLNLVGEIPTWVIATNSGDSLLNSQTGETL